MIEKIIFETKRELLDYLAIIALGYCEIQAYTDENNKKWYELAIEFVNEEI